MEVEADLKPDYDRAVARLLGEDLDAAIRIPFQTLPVNLYLRGPRYRVMFDRIVTPRFTREVPNL